MGSSLAYKRRKRRERPRQRNPEETAIILEAKKLLMSRNHMTEEEAHRYIQKTSMDNSTDMVETAQMVLTVMEE
jgi:response regulator NasT